MAALNPALDLLEIVQIATVEAAIAHGVPDAVRSGVIPKDKVNDLGIIYSVWLDPSVTKVEEVDHKAHLRPPRGNGQRHRQGDAE